MIQSEPGTNVHNDSADDNSLCIDDCDDDSTKGSDGDSDSNESAVVLVSLIYAFSHSCWSFSRSDAHLMKLLQSIKSVKNDAK